MFLGRQAILTDQVLRDEQEAAMVFAQICRADNADPRIVTDRKVQVLNRIGPVTHSAGVEFEDLVLELVVGLRCIGPGLCCFPEVFGLDLEVLEHALFAFVVGIYCMEVE